MIDWLTKATLGELITAIVGGLAAISTVIQLSPIKINPWSWLSKLIKKIGRAIGKCLNGEVLDKVDKMEKDIEKLRGEIQAQRDTADERAARGSRTRVLRFGDEVIHKTQHSKEHFDDVLRDISSYEKYCADHPEFENDQMQITAQLIKDTYRKCMEDDSFI